MPVFTDQLGRNISIDRKPQRIVSLVPSQTELLFDLGLKENIVGITKFCIHPDETFRTIIKIGGTKQLNLEKINALQPDLIIANKEENEKAQIEELSMHFPVWISDIQSLDHALQMIRSIGEITYTVDQAIRINEQIVERFSNLFSQPLPQPLPACYLIWSKPYMTIGGDCFINDMLMRAGFDNVFKNESRYPVITIDQIEKTRCKFILLSSEPYPFSQKHIAEIQSQLPNTCIILVDGEMFSWYGSRLIQAPSYFQQLRQQVLSLADAAGIV